MNRAANFPLLPIGLIGVTTLLFEILLTRIFSVTMWYHFAFVIISLALLGVAASGVVVTVAPRFFSYERARKQLAVAAFLFGVSVPLSFLVDLKLPFLPFEPWVTGAKTTWLLPYVLFSAKFIVLSVPFFFSGLCIALAFTHFSTQANRIYFADLAGAGLGCALVVPTLLYFSGPSAVIFAAAFAFGSSALLARSGRMPRFAVVGALAAVSMVVLAVVNESEDYIVISRIKSYNRARAQVEEREKVYEEWHPVSRVAVHSLAVSNDSREWFHSYDSEARLPGLMEVTNDGGARTFIWPRQTVEERAKIFRDDLSDIVYSMAVRPDVLVVGVGGGKDIIAALTLGAADVTGVELNPLMIDVVQDEFADFSGRPYDDPRVHIVIEEGRNFIASHDKKYDVIKISGTDTWAASVVGAYALTENYLYTKEAIHDFLDHLTPGGYLSITRWYPQETYRLAALASVVLRARGVENPEAQVLMACNRSDRDEPIRTMTLIIKNGEISTEEEENFLATVEKAGFVLIHSPGMQEGASRSPVEQAHRAILSAASFEGLGTDLGYNIEPPTDDKPFFFNVVGFESAKAHEYGARRGFILQHGRALNLLFNLLIITVVIALVFVIGPLVFAGAGGNTRSGIPFVPKLGVNLYFMMLGFGYLLVEIPLLQQFILFLGHPTYAVTVVLFSLLVSSGVGSYLTGRSYPVSLPFSKLIFVAIVVLILLGGIYLPSVLRAQIGLPIAIRVAVAIALITPLGLLLGVPFPLGIRHARRVGPGLVPWAWAVNGAASVAAPVMAMVIAVVAGFKMALWLGAVTYLLAGLFLPLFEQKPVPVDEASSTA